tara:strand:- start:187084 stop:187944 length:861 start_codon:yes stop_codon:yes gene_type:complete
MKLNLVRLVFFFNILLLSTCSNFGELKLISELPTELKEVSGTETTRHSNLLWMVNDSGNTNTVFGVSTSGTIEKTLRIDAKNHDWEDLTSDPIGNLYIGDFGNNNNDRKNLSILKIAATDLTSEEKITVEKIHFYFPEQNKFPPKKNQRYFDVESFFYHNAHFYLFTRSRVKGNYGKTSLYKIPAKPGNHEAAFIDNYVSCSDYNCSITSAAISPDGKAVILLSRSSMLVFTSFKSDNFLSGIVKELPFNFISQKESICFKDSSTIYITDEYANQTGKNLYAYKFK